eukprot:COSAG02_NODE_72447_length_185_cov_46.232558_1_plen_45_part_01
MASVLLPISPLRAHTDGQKVKSDSGSEITILAGTIDFPDFCTMVR